MMKTWIRDILMIVSISVGVALFASDQCPPHKWETADCVRVHGVTWDWRAIVDTVQVERLHSAIEDTLRVYFWRCSICGHREVMVEQAFIPYAQPPWQRHVGLKILKMSSPIECSPSAEEVEGN